MIPASSFLLDGDTALVVFDPMQTCDPGMEPWPDLDRPCDNCEWAIEAHGLPPGQAPWCSVYDYCVDDCVDEYTTCPDCDGTGGRTFDIEVVGEMVEATHAAHGWTMAPPRRNLRVHVIDVLEIPANAALSVLPPDAAPGKWLVRLAVRTPENVEEPT